jgi:hypothetical protein
MGFSSFLGFALILTREKHLSTKGTKFHQGIRKAAPVSSCSFVSFVDDQGFSGLAGIAPCLPLEKLRYR